MRTLLLGFVAWVAGGCATIGTVQTARPIDPGTVQVGLEPGMSGTQDRGWVPTANVMARYGITRHLDLGVRFGAGGLGLTGKLALTDPWDDRVALSVAPMVGGFGLGLLGEGRRSHYWQVPLIVGVGFRGGHELVLAPKVTGWAMSGGAGQARGRSVLGVGGTVGLALRVYPGVRILPEIGMVQPLFGRASGKVLLWRVDTRAGVPIYQATVGILLGGDR
ncbi:MAG: hypothetical protein Q8P18_11695 [Pseudomonadota bacterium]|nr:hypothetical protein [Pseudomonadota bacterium]